MRIYVGNMSFSTSEQALRSEFEKYGAVDDVTIVTDRETGRPRGFAFVNMPNPSEGSAAMEAVNGLELDGRTLNVSEARPRKEGGGGGGGRGGGGGGYRR
jgi:RNA recognition motif-containing protein